jgi:hypothetical protein
MLLPKIVFTLILAPHATIEKPVVSLAPPWLALLLVSPLYLARIVTLLAGVVTVTEQPPDVSVQAFEGDMMLLFPEAEKVRVPVCDGYPPVTVAVQVIGVLMAKGYGVHDIVVTVGALLIVNLAVRKLP